MDRIVGTLVALLLALAGQAVAQESQIPPQRLTLRLQEAFQRALAGNLALRRARADVSVAEAQKRGAVSAILPRLTASAGLIRNSREVSFGSQGSSTVILPLNDWNLRISLQQPLFAGWREQRVYQQTKVGIESARAGVWSAESQVLLSVAADYLGAAEAEALLAVEQQNLALSERLKTQAGDLRDAGEATQVDVLRAETAVKAALRRVAAARQARETAVGRLRMDLAWDGEIAVSDPGALGPPLRAEADLVSQAEASRPEVELARKALAIASLEVSKQRGANLPVLTADAGYVYQKTAFPTDRYGYAALRLTVPLYQGGEVGIRVAAAETREQQARLWLEEVRRAVREDVRKACLDLETAETSLALAREQLAAAEAAYRQTFDLYQSQELTSLDVMAAESALAEARRAVVNGKYDRTLAELRVHFAAGSLRETVLKEVQP